MRIYYPVLLMLLKLVSISCAILTFGFTFDIKPLISQMRIMCYCSTTRFWVNLRIINQTGNILHIAKTWFRKKDFSDILKISKKFQKKFQKSYFEWHLWTTAFKMEILWIYLISPGSEFLYYIMIRWRGYYDFHFPSQKWVVDNLNKIIININPVTLKYWIKHP